MAALERVRARLPADLPVMADAKRGDISTTAAHQAIALFDGLGADAVTVNPYVGREGLEPLLTRAGRFAYVLCRTSNPGADELQDLVVEADPSTGAPAEPLYLRVARRVAAWGPDGTVGLVVGATAPVELRAIRATVPGLAFLVPGIGTQGGDLGAVLADGPVAAGAACEPAGPRPAGQRFSGYRGSGDRGVGARLEGGAGGASRWSRARLGGPAACATLARASTFARASRRTARSGWHPAGADTIMPTPGPLELVIILVIALLILGPGKLPDVGAALGKSIREFRKASSDVQDAVEGRRRHDPAAEHPELGTRRGHDRDAGAGGRDSPPPPAATPDPTTVAK